MSKTNNNKNYIHLKEAKAIIKRFNQGKQTSTDEQVVSTFALPGENDWSKALDRFLKSKQKAKETQLDLFFDNGLMIPFKDDNSAIPKQMLRGSLFAPIRPGRRKLIQDKLVGEFTGGEIRYSGAQLDQNDLDVLLKLNELLSELSQTGNVERVINESGRTEYSLIKFTRYSFLKSLERSVDKKSYKALEYSLDRLTGLLKVKLEGVGKINGGILGKTYLMDDGMMGVQINHDYIKLFADGNFSFIDMASRLELKGPFAKWLQGFISTHSGVSQYSAEKLIELSGSKPSRTRQWMQRQAVPAFEQLQNLGEIKWFTVKEHLFKWER
jgi:hypothetical protein